MSAPLPELVRRLASPDAGHSGLALGELVERGPEAVPALLDALTAPDPRVRALAAEGLGMIGDARAADALAAAVDDGHERVRAQAATALARLGDPRGVDAVIRTIDDYHDLAHSDLSLSAYTLAGLGPPVAARVVPLLGAGEARTRVKAIWVLRAIASSREWSELQRLLAAYEPGGPADERARVAAAAGAWLERQAR